MSIGGKGGRPLGAPKTGGRKRGTPNKRTMEVEEKLATLGCDPIKILADVTMDEKAPLEARIRCAIELSSYIHPKRRPIENLSPPQSTIELKTIVENEPQKSVGIADENREET